MKFIYAYIIGLTLLLSTTVFGQDYSHSTIYNALNNSNDSTSVVLSEPASLSILVDKHVRMNKESGVIGYRIQINQWAGQNGRERANQASLSFTEKFPEFNSNLIYINYVAPYFRLRIGDFRNRHEAFEYYNQVRKDFPNSYIVRARIKYPLMPSKSETIDQ